MQHRARAARIIEDIGYEAAYVTGAGAANMCLGAADIGLTTLTEIAAHVAAIAAQRSRCVRLWSTALTQSLPKQELTRADPA